MKKFEEEKTEEVTNSKKTKVVPSMPVPKPLFGGFSSFFGPAKPMSVPARKVESKPADNPVSKPEVKSTTPPPAAKTETKKADVKPTPKATQSKAKPTGFSPEYKTFAKSSKEARDFRKNFGEARKSGAKEFEFQGRKYNTKVKGE